MSRKNAQLVKVTDLQCKQSDVILTKGDIDLIFNGLWALKILNDKQREERNKLATYFNSLRQ